MRAVILVGFVVSAAIGLAVWQSLTPATNPPRKKLIYYGWGTQDTLFVRQHWQEMETMPFDGIGITVAIDRTKPTIGNGATGNLLGWHIFGPKAFRLDDFRPAINDVRVAQWRKFTDNFLPVCICSSGQDFGFNWFDEKRWQTVLNNWRILVTIAKEGGLKGIILDPEHYGARFFHYPTMRQRLDEPFEAYVERARQCGRQLMEMTRTIFPDITVLMFWAHSHPAFYRETNLARAGYGLLPAFVDGMMEGADERAQFVDLCEFAYGFKERQQFLEAYHTIVNKAATFSLLPDLYRRNIRVGFGLWLDYKSGRQGWDVNDLRRNYFAPEEFQRSLQMALELSDEYVWIYTQQPRFFPPRNLPDAYLNAIRAARQSVGLSD